MHRILLMIPGLLVLAFASLLTSTHVTAGEYYDGGYVSRGAVSHSSSCCYRKVVRIVRTVRYVRVDDGYRHGYYAPRHRSSYYGTPYRSTYYGEPYRSAYDYDRPYRYDGGGYYGGYYGGYGVSRVSYGYGESCTVRRVRVADGYGGWVWARSRVCY